MYTNVQQDVLDKAQPEGHRSVRLPDELIRYIFETATIRSQRDRIVWDLQLVARRVQSWLQPILFESLFIGDSVAFYSILDIVLENPERTALIKHLFLGLFDKNREDVNTLISLCTRITSIASNSGFDYSAIANIQLNRLAVHSELVDYALLSTQSFAFLTHLEIFDSITDCEMDFGLFPCLTHLAFNSTIYEDEIEEMEELRTVMEDCPRLVMLLILAMDEENVVTTISSLQQIASPRLYVWKSQALIRDWKDHLAGLDIWEKAKGFTDRSQVVRHEEFDVDFCRGFWITVDQPQIPVSATESRI